jgi:hypothetical protein
MNRLRLHRLEWAVPDLIDICTVEFMVVEPAFGC